MAPLLQYALTLMTYLTLSQAHNILLRANARDCFHETLHKDDKMTVTYQVGDREGGGSGNLDIDFWVCVSQFRAFTKQPGTRSEGCLPG